MAGVGVVDCAGCDGGGVVLRRGIGRRVLPPLKRAWGEGGRDCGAVRFVVAAVGGAPVVDCAGFAVCVGGSDGEWVRH